MTTAGIDCSTTVCGWAIVDSSFDKVVAWGHHEFSKNSDISSKLFEFVKFVLPRLTEHSPDMYVLEDFLKAFNGGGTSASAMMGLAQMNGGIDFILMDRFGFSKVKKVHPSTARKKSIGEGVLTKKSALERGFLSDNGKILTKEWILHTISAKYPEFKITDYTPRSNKPKPYYYDIADAIVLATSV